MPSITKEVAVKVLRRGYDTRALLKRFKVETQILATLDHPNIARLLDAGSTSEGLPYLVMDYIKGMPIDEYCRKNQLGLNERLILFRKLCGAVQYVHQHLMVHGDLKCSNVLVSEQGAVKLLDFGIARLLNPNPSPGLPDQKLTAIVAMTPEYASPEQIKGGAITHLERRVFAWCRALSARDGRAALPDSRRVLVRARHRDHPARSGSPEHCLRTQESRSGIGGAHALRPAAARRSRQHHSDGA